MGQSRPMLVCFRGVPAMNVKDDGHDDHDHGRWGCSAKQCRPCCPAERRRLLWNYGAPGWTAASWGGGRVATSTAVGGKVPHLAWVVSSATPSCDNLNEWTASGGSCSVVLTWVGRWWCLQPEFVNGPLRNHLRSHLHGRPVYRLWLVSPHLYQVLIPHGQLPAFHAQNPRGHHRQSEGHGARRC